MERFRSGRHGSARIEPCHLFSIKGRVSAPGPARFRTFNSFAIPDHLVFHQICLTLPSPAGARGLSGNLRITAGGDFHPALRIIRATAISAGPSLSACGLPGLRRHCIDVPAVLAYHRQSSFSVFRFVFFWPPEGTIPSPAGQAVIIMVLTWKVKPHGVAPAFVHAWQHSPCRGEAVNRKARTPP